MNLNYADFKETMRIYSGMANQFFRPQAEICYCFKYLMVEKKKETFHNNRLNK